MEKPKDTWRVANFGDSYVEGIQEVDWDKNFVTQLEKYLQDNYTVATSSSTLNFQSLNFGVAGRGQIEEYWTYKYLASKANPDLNIVWFTIANDFSNNLVPPQPSGALESNQSGRIKYFLKKSALANFLFEYLKGNPFFLKIFNALHLSNSGKLNAEILAGAGDGVDIDRKINYSIQPGLEKEKERAYGITSELLQNFQKLSNEKKSKFLVVIIPEPMIIYNLYDDFFKVYPRAKIEDYDFTLAEKKLLEILKKNNIAYLDLTDEFTKYALGKSAYENCGNLFGDHFSACGHKIAAQIVGKYILENYLR